jgi:hypothetical protein
MLAKYAWHYNEYRPHQSLEQRPPPQQPSQPIDVTARIKRTHVVHGLTSEYRRATSAASGSSFAAAGPAEDAACRTVHRLACCLPASLRLDDHRPGGHFWPARTVPLVTASLPELRADNADAKVLSGQARIREEEIAKKK